MTQHTADPAPRLDLARCRRWAEQRGLPPQAEARDLVSVGEDRIGRPLRVARSCAARWRAMHRAAARDAVELILVSAFRSVEQQCGIFERKLERGDALEDILCVHAAPGYSEHHSGRALDLGTPGCEDLSEAFEHTPAFRWLGEHAGAFGFALSYPRDNAFGITYEPWHWAAREE